ncbi:hypothetical protein ACKP2L_02635 [Oenococcus alcoholitolerans]|uniref:hypothetical protein n=1 Tax=Oenococcus alcoholitolerans TaxID=931074 RepID=UPI003F7278A7
MEKIFLKKYILWFFLSLILSIGGPFLFRLDFLDGARRVLWMLIIIFGGFSLYSGYFFKINRSSFWGVLIFPATFSAVNLIFRMLSGSSLVSSDYAYYFALIYLILSLFTFFGDYKYKNSNEKDDNPFAKNKIGIIGRIKHAEK